MTVIMKFFAVFQLRIIFFKIKSKKNNILLRNIIMFHYTKNIFFMKKMLPYDIILMITSFKKHAYVILLYIYKCFFLLE